MRRSRDVHSVGKLRNVNAPSVTLSCMIVFQLFIQGHSNWGGQGGYAPPPPPSPTSISKLSKVQQFQFQTSGMMLFVRVQKLCGPKVSRFLPSMLHLRWLFSFSNYIGEIGEIDLFTLDHLKMSDSYRWTFWKASYCGPSKRRPQWTRVNVRL